VAETGIAWPVDLEKKYGAQGASHFNDVPALRGGGAVAGPLNGDEHLAVWMRTAALPAFRKLWGRVAQDLPAGALVTVTVANRRAPLAAAGNRYAILHIFASCVSGKPAHAAGAACMRSGPTLAGTGSAVRAQPLQSRRSAFRHH